jgi:dihydrofolate synthase/folylpolyglutamate synthase
VITRVDFDHENFLGHSLREIASEKAGILKQGIPVVLAAQQPEAREVILALAKKLACPVIETPLAYRVDEQAMENGCVRARITEITSGWSAKLAPQLAGRFQLQNAMNAVAAARALSGRGWRIPERALEQGIAAAIWPGRLEKLQSRPDLYVDGAHNPGAARELAAFWEENFAGRKIFLLYGALRDKAVDEIAGVLFPRAAEVVFSEARTSRAISAAQLSEIAAHHAARSSVITGAEQALDYLLSKAAPQDAVFVTGSLYLVGQLRHYWKQRAQVAAG